MKDIEQQAKDMINKQFESQPKKKAIGGPTFLSETVEATFPDMTDYDRFSNKDEHEYFVASYHIEVCQTLTKERFRKILNVVLNAEVIFFDMVTHFFNEESAKSIQLLVGESSKLFLGILVDAMENKESTVTYMDSMKKVSGSNQVIHQILEEYGYETTIEEGALAYMTRELLKNYLHALSEKNLRTDFSSQARFMSQLKLLSNQMTEVLWDMHASYHAS